MEEGRMLGVEDLVRIARAREGVRSGDYCWEREVDVQEWFKDAIEETEVPPGEEGG